MYRYTLVAIAVFIAASADSTSSQEDIEVEFKATTPPVASSNWSSYESAQRNDTKKSTQKSPREPQLIGSRGVSKAVPWPSNGGYGSGAPNDTPYGGSYGAAGYGWKIPGLEGPFGGPDQNGVPYGPPIPMGPGPYEPQVPPGPGPYGPPGPPGSG
ncbi:hypothetical protein GCK32_012062, partial [Trichostrongylus colubriformis]